MHAAAPLALMSGACQPDLLDPPREAHGGDGVGEVRRVGRSAEALCELPERPLAPGDESEACARRREALGERTADAAGGSGHHDASVGELQGRSFRRDRRGDP